MTFLPCMGNLVICQCNAIPEGDVPAPLCRCRTDRVSTFVALSIASLTFPVQVYLLQSILL